jgi:hypothetical protein
LKLTLRHVKVVRWDRPASDVKFCTDAQRPQAADSQQTWTRAAIWPQDCSYLTLKQYERSSSLKSVLGRPASGRDGGQLMLSAEHCESCRLVP